MEYFLAYAPELNPDEYIWTQTDRTLSNSAPESLNELNLLIETYIGGQLFPHFLK
jgi:hypothetical protein